MSVWLVQLGQQWHLYKPSLGTFSLGTPYDNTMEGVWAEQLIDFWATVDIFRALLIACGAISHYTNSVSLVQLTREIVDCLPASLILDALPNCVSQLVANTHTDFKYQSIQGSRVALRTLQEWSCSTAQTVTRVVLHPL